MMKPFRSASCLGSLLLACACAQAEITKFEVLRVEPAFGVRKGP